MHDARQYALDQLPAHLDAAARQAAEAAIQDTLYGVMMIADGVSGALRNDDETLQLVLVVRCVHHGAGSTRMLEELDLAEGDGACMGFHGWINGDFGDDPVAVSAQSSD